MRSPHLAAGGWVAAEFQEVLAHFNVTLSDHKVYQLFARVGAHASAGSATINKYGIMPGEAWLVWLLTCCLGLRVCFSREEFEKAMKFLQDDLADSAMRNLNMAAPELYFWAATTVLLLALVLLFLMMGISAFTEANSFR